MKKVHTFATLFIAAYAVSTGALGQNVYRCGASYSQTPCPGAVTVETDDARSPQQKAQADRAIARDVAAANTLEKARLKEEEEAQALKLRPSGAKSNKAKNTKSRAQPKSGDQLIGSKVPTSSDRTKKTKGKKKKAPEFFTAKVIAQKKKPNP